MFAVPLVLAGVAPENSERSGQDLWHLYRYNLGASALLYLYSDLRLCQLILFANAQMFQDFCKPSDWPPIKELQITKGKDGQSCKFACLDKGLVCEPTFFATVNSQEMFKR